MTTQTIIPSEEHPSRLGDILAMFPNINHGPIDKREYRAALKALADLYHRTPVAEARTSSAVPSVGEAVAWLHKLTGVVRFDRPYVGVADGDYTPLYTHPLPSTEPSEMMVERAARAIAGTAWEGIYFTTRSREEYIEAEWRNHATDAGTALRAALNESQSK